DAAALLSLGGMNGFSQWAAAFSIRLCSLLRGTTAGPDSPPLRIDCGVSSTKSALALVWLWQARQLFLRIGNISFSKSTGLERLSLAMGMALVLAASCAGMLLEGERLRLGLGLRLRVGV